jgi:hypothetical protein
MSLDSLFTVYKQNAKNLDDAEIKTAISGLFQQLEDPSSYNAPRFAAQLQKVSALCPRTREAAKYGFEARQAIPSAEHQRLAERSQEMVGPWRKWGHTCASVHGEACEKITVPTAVPGNFSLTIWRAAKPIDGEKMELPAFAILTNC